MHLAVNPQPSTLILKIQTLIPEPRTLNRGRVSEHAGHLQSCGYEKVACPNAAAGCTESVRRKDVARHADEACAYTIFVPEEGLPAAGRCLVR